MTEDKRIFVNFPHCTEDTAVSVAALLPDGGVRPCPDAEWNAWRNARRHPCVIFIKHTGAPA